MADYKVTITGNGFNPKSLEIKAGDRVYWVNEDSMDHTATNTNPENGEIFHTGVLRGKPKEPYMSGLFKFKKSTTYICMIHDGMVGKITVKP